MNERVSAKLRELVAQRAGMCCEYCRCPAAYCPAPYSVEHIVPRNLGGSSDPENLALSCLGCNGHKYVAIEASDPVTDDVVPLYHPRRDVWSDHFSWEDNFTVLVGLTDVGRATIHRLQLNRIGRSITSPDAKGRNLAAKLEVTPDSCQNGKAIGNRNRNPIVLRNWIATTSLAAIGCVDSQRIGIRLAF